MRESEEGQARREEREEGCGTHSPDNHVTDDSLNRPLDPKVPGLDNSRIF